MKRKNDSESKSPQKRFCTTPANENSSPPRGNDENLKAVPGAPRKQRSVARARTNNSSVVQILHYNRKPNELAGIEQHTEYFKNNNVGKLKCMLSENKLLTEELWETLMLEVVPTLKEECLELLPSFLEDNQHSKLVELAEKLSMDSMSVTDYLHYQITIQVGTDFSGELNGYLVQNELINNKIINYALKDNGNFFKMICENMQHILHNPAFKESVVASCIDEISLQFARTGANKSLQFSFLQEITPKDLTLKQLEGKLVDFMKIIPKNVLNQVMLEIDASKLNTKIIAKPDVLLKKAWHLAQKTHEKIWCINQFFYSDVNQLVVEGMLTASEQDWKKPETPAVKLV